MSTSDAKNLALLMKQLCDLENQWQELIEKPTTSNRDLCMKQCIVSKPVVLPHNLGLDITADYLLLLVYLPATSVVSGNVLDNPTLNISVKPVLGSSLFIVELLHCGYLDNDDVDLPLVTKICADPTHFVVVNYQQRIKTVLQIRQLLGANNLGWVGGMDAATAITTLTRGEFTLMADLGIEGLHCGDLGYLLISVYHPSRPLVSKGDPTSTNAVRQSLNIFKVVSQLVRDNIRLTSHAIAKQLSAGQLAHWRMWTETRRMLTFILGPSRLGVLLDTKPGLLHHDSTNMLAALDHVSNSRATW